MAVYTGYAEFKNDWYFYATEDGRIWQKVRPGKIPLWFKKTIQFYYDGKISQRDIRLYNHILPWGNFDHTATLRRKCHRLGKSEEIHEYFISEPYDVDIEKLYYFCKQYHLEVSLSGHSFNGSGAVQILFYPRNDNPFTNKIFKF